MNVEYYYDESALAALREERGGDLPAKRTTVVADGMIPVAGDLVTDDNVSRHVFEVANRRIHTAADGCVSVILVLVLANVPKVAPTLGVVAGGQPGSTR